MKKYVDPRRDTSASGRMKRLEEFLSSKDDGTFYVGHACILVRIAGRKYLVDSVYPRPLFLDSWLFFPELTLDDRFFDTVDGVFISHLHEDHYDPNYLARLKKGTPIYITEGRSGFSVIENDPQFHVRKIPPMERHAINSDVDVLAVPSDHNSFDSSFIIKGKNFGVYQGNDNFLSKDVMLQAKSLIGTVDQAYIPFAYVWWYPFCLTSMTPEQRGLRQNDSPITIWKSGE